jgi:hypothetical protein
LPLAQVRGAGVVPPADSHWWPQVPSGLQVGSMFPVAVQLTFCQLPSASHTCGVPPLQRRVLGAQVVHMPPRHA